MTDSDQTQPVIGRIEIPQRNSTEGMPFLSFKHGRY